MPLPVVDQEPREVTLLLRQWKDGDPAAMEELVTLIYPELLKLARRNLRGSRDAQKVLSPTELVHEAFLRLAGQNQPDWNHRAQFYYVAARVMRQVLVDYVRELRSQKRGGGAVPLSLETVSIPGIGENPIDVVDIHEALARLEQFDVRKAKVLELRFFVGMNTEEIAKVLGVSAITVARDVRTSMAWLRTQLKSFS
ncbi:MAG: sigma-70 family RNA polymerase sigma factor [Bryobacterales bacterium]|nr:sigma-70 family RNA polymerase sigma factor [Bryobacterales bacterium]